MPFFLIIMGVLSTADVKSGLARNYQEFRDKDEAVLLAKYGAPDNKSTLRGWQLLTFKDKYKRDCTLRFFVRDGKVSGAYAQGEECF